MGGYTRAVSGQRLGKHIPAATNQHATIQVLLGVSMWSMSRSYKEDTWGDQVCSVWESVKRTRGREAEESPLLEAVAR
jgi:hypothetical protein